MGFLKKKKKEVPVPEPEPEAEVLDAEEDVEDDDDEDEVDMPLPPKKKKKKLYTLQLSKAQVLERIEKLKRSQDLQAYLSVLAGEREYNELLELQGLLKE
jgi:hypothetical protein